MGFSQTASDLCIKEKEYLSSGKNIINYEIYLHSVYIILKHSLYNSLYMTIRSTGCITYGLLLWLYNLKRYTKVQ